MINNKINSSNYLSNSIKEVGRFYCSMFSKMCSEYLIGNKGFEKKNNFYVKIIAKFNRKNVLQQLLRPHRRYVPSGFTRYEHQHQKNGKRKMA